jgi:hypothetical protein
MACVNFPGMQRGEREASELFLKAVQESNRILGVGTGGQVNINLGGGEETVRGGRKGMNVEFVHSPMSGQVDEPGERYSAKVLPHPRLVEATANEPESTTGDQIPSEQLGRPGPQPVPVANTNPMRPARVEPPVVADEMTDHSPQRRQDQTNQKPNSIYRGNATDLDFKRAIAAFRPPHPTSTRATNELVARDAFSQARTAAESSV